MSANVFRAGAATSNITPALGMSINGGMRNRVATHVHDELHARCLVLDDGQSQLALVICDSCMIPAEVFDAAKHLAHGHTGLPPDRMLMAATHTHSAPAVAGVFQTDPDPAYAEFLALRISDGVRRAMNNLEPAKVGWGIGREASQVFNRRWRMKAGTIPADPFGGTTDSVRMNPPRASADLLDPAGPIDPEVAVLAVTAADGRPLAMLANYSLHYVGGTGTGHISADYFGMFAARVERLLGRHGAGPPMVATMSNGTSGNINNVNFRRSSARQPAYEQMRLVAHLLSDEAVRVWQSIQLRDHVSLDVRSSRLRLGRRVPSKDEVARAKFVLSQGEGADLKTRQEIYARETVLLADEPPIKETTVQALRIGELGIAALPCEVFVETGLAIKSESPLKPTFTVELANDYAGYLPTVEHHRLGGYETWRARSSYLEVEAEPRMRKQVLGLLRDLSGAT